jgi:rhodanese-related sulfurtransferase
MNNRKHMKQMILKQLLLGMSLWGFLLFTMPAANLVPFSDITPSQAAALIAEKGASPLFIILDVRTAKEFAENHIKDALNIDVKAPDFKESIDKLDRNSIYLVYCLVGVRSAKAMNLMREWGFKQVYNLAGGFKKWQEEKLPREINSDKANIPPNSAAQES